MAVWSRLPSTTLYVIGGDARYDGSCKLNVSFSGVVVAQSGRRLSEKIAASGYAEYCGDRPDWATPLASLEVNEKVLWIVRVSVEDGYDYVSMRGAVEYLHDGEAASRDIERLARRYATGADLERRLTGFRGQQRVSFRFMPRSVLRHS